MKALHLNSPNGYKVSIDVNKVRLFNQLNSTLTEIYITPEKDKMTNKPIVETSLKILVLENIEKVRSIYKQLKLSNN